MRSTLTLVTGATGQQGGAVTWHLLKQGHNVRVFARNPGSDEARALLAAGAEVATGDFRDPTSLRAAAQGVDAAFIVASPVQDSPGAESEMAIAAIDAVASAEVSHIVYSSVAGADRNTHIPHFESKAEVERHLRSLSVGHSVIAPVFFYENVLSPYVLPALQQNMLALGLPPTRKLQMMAVNLIGEITALVLTRPEAYAGRRIELASDEISGEEAAGIIAQVSGRAVNYLEVAAQNMRELSEDMALMYEWLDRVGYSADIPALKAEFPDAGWLNFAEWAQLQDWSILDEDQPPADLENQPQP